MAALALVGVAGVVLSACGSSLINGASPTSVPGAGTNSTVPSGEVAVAFPVVICSSSTGGSLGTSGWKPSVLLAPIPTALVSKVEFYSDGVHTVLGPTGWTCSQTQTAGSASGLVVYPPDTPTPPVTTPVAPGTEGVFASFDLTGEASGVLLVCPFFLMPAFQTARAKCPATKPSGEQSSMPTPDVASVTDPAGVVGSLAGSGGTHPVTGTVIFPQESPQVAEGGSVAVAVESCALPDTSLCPTVLSDFDVREFPVPGSANRPTSVAPVTTTTAPSPVATAPTTPATTPPATTTTVAPVTTTTAAATTTPAG